MQISITNRRSKSSNQSKSIIDELAKLLRALGLKYIYIYLYIFFTCIIFHILITLRLMFKCQKSASYGEPYACLSTCLE